MQMDKTQIAVRERGLFEVMELALQLYRVYARPIFVATLLGALPFALLNYWLVGWMAAPDFIEYSTVWIPFRYCWNLGLLTYIEAPLATTLVTAFLGKAVFEARPSLRQVLRDVFACRWQLLWFCAVLRGPVPAWLLVAGVETGDDYSAFEFFLFVVAFYAAAVRSLRPFMTEIVQLERNPWRAGDKQVMTVGKRSFFLHSAAYGDLLGRWLGAVWIGGLLAASLAGNLLFVVGVMTGSWRFSWTFVVWLVPLAWWMLAGYMAVVRFLSYLDLRIRQEGWEVELRMRAEAARMAGPNLGGAVAE